MKFVEQTFNDENEEVGKEGSEEIDNSVKESP